MAKQNNRNSGKSCNSNKSGRSRRPKYSELENLAYKLGQIQSGLASDTKVKDSYDNGKASKNKEKKKKKPLY